MANTQTPISPVTTSKPPEFTISAPAVNSEPVELDSTPTSAEKVHDLKHGSKPEQLSPEEQKV